MRWGFRSGKESYDETPSIQECVILEKLSLQHCVSVLNPRPSIGTGSYPLLCNPDDYVQKQAVQPQYRIHTDYLFRSQI